MKSGFFLNDGVRLCKQELCLKKIFYLLLYFFIFFVCLQLFTPGFFLADELSFLHSFFKK